MWSLVAKPFTKFALSKSGRARMPKINRTDLLSYDYRFPNRNEQQRIVSYLDSIQSEMNELDLILQKNAKLIDQIEQSILERAFRGEL
jgi:restriction endonuclease S subunit